MNSYSVFARHYDDLTRNIDYPARAAYFHTLIQEYAPEAHSLLDLACGTGSLAFALAPYDYDMVATDGSPDMLTEAFSKLEEEPILFLLQTMEELELMGSMDVTVCALDSINHLPQLDTVAQVFRRVAEYSHGGSLFLFDVNTLYKHREILAENTFVYETDAVYCVWENQYQPETGQVDITLDFFEWEEENCYSRSGESFSEYYYSTEQLTRLLEQNGFVLEGVFHEDTLEPPKETSQRLVFVARKS